MEKNTEKNNSLLNLLMRIFSSSVMRKVLYSILILVVTITVFQIGVYVGYHKASFSFRMADDYSRLFDGPKKGNFTSFRPKDFSTAHGVFGQIIKLELPDLYVDGMDGIEKRVVISDVTKIRRFRENIDPKQLKIGDYVVVFGSPDNQSRIEAKLIRIMESR